MSSVVKLRAEWRQIAIVAIYWSLLGAMYALPACQNVPLFALACGFSFVNAVVIHNHLHHGVFHARWLNQLFRCVLSFGALYPASANIPSHNLVHHHFDDDGQPDWAAPGQVAFSWNLLNLLHFPNVAGPRTFAGVGRWMRTCRHPGFARQYLIESGFALGLTGLLLLHDFWSGLFFVVLPQLYGARCILRINLLQHDGCDIASDWNHSRNFVGRGLNWILCNNGFHTIHHNRAGLHWSELPQHHDRDVTPRIDPALDEASLIRFLARTYLLRRRRAAPRDLARAEQIATPLALASRAQRRDAAEAASG